jgi:hypothetical protein
MSSLHIFESTAPDGALNGNQLAYLSQLQKKGSAKWDRSYRQICYDGLSAGTEARHTFMILDCRFQIANLGTYLF